jgi:hypothetical protein
MTALLLILLGFPARQGSKVDHLAGCGPRRPQAYAM